MKVAKNMDSVFANCTEDELDFDVIFSDDDTIIDFIAGVDEAGIPLTGPDFDYSTILSESDMLEDQDDADSRDGKLDHKSTAPEGSTEKDFEIGGEVGDGKDVTGKENSKESEAYDMIKLDSETAQHNAIIKAMEISAKKFADQSCAGCCCKENSEYEEYKDLIECVVDGFMTEEDIMSEDASQIAINTADYLIECADAEAREGKVDPDNKGNIEGVKSKLIDRQTTGSSSGDPIADYSDQDARDGKLSFDKNVEAVANRVIGAAMEAVASGDIDKELESNTDDYSVEKMDREIVPDSIRDNSDANRVDIKQESSEFVQDSYKQLIGEMKIGLQKLALANSLDESVITTAAAIYEASEGVEESYSDYAEYQEIIEAVINNMDVDDIMSENAAEFAIDTANFIISESEYYLEDKIPDDKIDISDKDGKVVKKTIAARAKEFVTNHQKIAKGAAIGTGVAALGVGGAIAAKKIADKKKAAKQNQEVEKENYEYPEYAELIEAVIDTFTEEEIMIENASDIACAIADYIIENSDELADDYDDDDIESVANNDDESEINLQYDYGDDELIDMVANDDQL